MIKNYGRCGDSVIFPITSTDDYIFAAIDGVVNQIHKSRKELIFIYDCKIKERHKICSIATSTDQKYVFITDNAIHLKSFSIEGLNSTIYNYGKVIKNGKLNLTSFIAVTPKFVFVAAENGHVLQYDITKQTLFRNWGYVLDTLGCGISCIKVTDDFKYLFIASTDGGQKQYYIDEIDQLEVTIFKSYDNIHQGSVKVLQVDRNCEYIYTGDNEGYIKQINIEAQTVYKDWGRVWKKSIYLFYYKKHQRVTIIV